MAEFRVGRITASIQQAFWRVGRVVATVTAPSAASPQFRVGQITATVTASAPTGFPKLRTAAGWSTASAVRTRKTSTSWVTGQANVLTAAGWHPITPPTNNRNSLVYGTYIPHNTNTGILNDRSTYTPYNSPGTATIFLDTSNQVFEGLEIFGDIVRRTGSNVTFRNCIFRGPKNFPSNDAAVIDCTRAGGTNTTVIDCTYAPQTPNYYRDFMIGHEYKAFRNRTIWANDHYGVYTQNSIGPIPTNVEIAGCFMSDAVYWHSTAAQYPGQPTGSMVDNNGATVAPYPLKTDGTHNDGVQIQGGLGGSHSIWVHGNRIRHNDAVQADPHPLGWADTVPVLGSQDGYKRYASGTNTLQPTFDGRYASNGQCLIVQQQTTTYNFPAIDTCVVEDNWVSHFGQNLIKTLGGTTAGISCTFRNNHFGENMYYFVPSNPSTYPIRIDQRAGSNVAGLNTNTWYEGHWATVGSVLVEGRTSGIRYDA